MPRSITLGPLFEALKPHIYKIEELFADANPKVQAAAAKTLVALDRVCENEGTFGKSTSCGAYIYQKSMRLWLLLATMHHRCYRCESCP